MCRSKKRRPGIGPTGRPRRAPERVRLQPPHRLVVAAAPACHKPPRTGGLCDAGRRAAPCGRADAVAPLRVVEHLVLDDLGAYADDRGWVVPAGCAVADNGPPAEAVRRASTRTTTASAIPSSAASTASRGIVLSPHTTTSWQFAMRRQFSVLPSTSGRDVLVR